MPSRQRIDPCPYCDEVHDPGPVGDDGGPFAGIELKVCPNIPPDHIYEDREYERGPRGALHKLTNCTRNCSCQRTCELTARQRVEAHLVCRFGARKPAQR